MADPRHAPLSFRPAPRVVRDEQFDEHLFERAASARPPDDDSLQEEPGARPAREGLPPSYRMRHDRHYVDQIASRRHAEPVHLVPVAAIDGPHPVQDAQELQALVASIAQVGVLQPLLVSRRNGRYQLIAGTRRLAAAIAAGLTEVPCIVHAVDEERARVLATAEAVRGQQAPEHREEKASPLPPAVFAEVIEHLGAIGACLHLFGERERPLRERVAMGLMQAEVQRAAWLAQALAVLAGEQQSVSNTVEVNGLVEKLLAALRPERTLAGAAFDYQPACEPCRVRGDEQLLTVAAAALASAVHALVERVNGARVTVRVSGEPGRVNVEASESVLSLVPEWRSRFFDLAWTERPGGVSVGAGLVAARRIAALHGGEVQLAAPDRGGCALTLALPAER